MNSPIAPCLRPSYSPLFTLLSPLPLVMAAVVSVIVVFIPTVRMSPSPPSVALPGPQHSGEATAAVLEDIQDKLEFLLLDKLHITVTASSFKSDQW